MSLPYTDQNGAELKEGDYFFYTESPHSNYADSLDQVVRHPETGELCSVNVVYNHLGSYRLADAKPDSEYYYSYFKYHSLDGNLMTDSLKVELVGPPLEFMNQMFPLSKSTRQS